MKRRTPPVNATLTAIMHLDSENVGGELVETLVYDWTGTAPMFATEQVEFDEAGGMIQADHRDQAVIPSDLVASEAPGFDLGYILRYQRLGQCELRKVTELEERADFGFLRCWTDELVALPDGEPDPCAGS